MYIRIIYYLNKINKWMDTLIQTNLNFQILFEFVLENINIGIYYLLMHLFILLH